MEIRVNLNTSHICVKSNHSHLFSKYQYLYIPLVLFVMVVLHPLLLFI